jgi:hypothetical protein
MGTKFRRDLKEEDFRILKRFKHHLHRLQINNHITLSTWSAKSVFVQDWYISCLGWADNGKKEVNDYPCYFLSMRDFRVIVRSITQDIPSITEGLVIQTLKRFSLILYKKDGHWKWQGKDGQPIIVLEHERLSPVGTIKKRNPETAKAQLEEYYEQIRKTMNDLGIDYQAALQELSVWGLTQELLDDLKQRVERGNAKRTECRAEVDKRIRQRAK